LRQRVIDAYLSQNRSAYEIAEQFSVGESSVNRWLALHRSTGSVAPKPAAGGQPSKLEGDTLDAVHILVLEKPDIIEREITSALDAIHKVRVSRSTVNRALHRLNLSRKKRPSSPPSGKVRGSSSSAGSTKRKSRRST
jgi:putative transposase